MSELYTDEVFKKLKKQNGEGVAKIIREAVLLNIPDIVHMLEFAGSNPNEVKLLVPVIREMNQEKPENIVKTDKDPLQLLKEAGYDAFVVKTEEQKNSIKKYYRPGEEICTFRDRNRHITNYIIHAVKHDAENIEPSAKPDRQDEYGTSVISIQIAKKGGFISIKNRYNHTVNDPDATFNNNPDNIIPGLSESLKKYFDVDFNVSESILPTIYRIVNNQIIRYNYEANDVYFGDKYFFNGNSITKLNNDYQYALDYFVLDIKTSELTNPSGINDSAFKILQNAFTGKKIKILPNPENKHEKMFFADNEHVLTVSDGQIVELNIPKEEHIDNSFLKFNRKLRSLNAPKLQSVGDNFLPRNQYLTNLSFPELVSVGNNFLRDNSTSLKEISLPKLQKAGTDFLSDNSSLTSLSLPLVQSIGSQSLQRFRSSDLYVPKLEEVSDDFLSYNQSEQLSFPALKKVGNGFLAHNSNLTKLSVPELENVGDEFLSSGLAIKQISLPKLKSTGNHFLVYNTGLKSIYAPNLETVGIGFLASNMSMKELSLPALKTCKLGFLNKNYILRALYLPALENVDSDSFLKDNSLLTEFIAPKLKQKGLLIRLKFRAAKNKLEQKVSKTKTSTAIVQSENYTL